MIGALFLESEHLNKDAKDSYTSHRVLGFILGVKNQSEFLKEVKIRECLIYCLPQDNVKDREYFKVLIEIVMRATLPWVGIGISIVGIDKN